MFLAIERLAPTNTKGTRVSVTDGNVTRTYPWDYAHNHNVNLIHALNQALREGVFIAEKDVGSISYTFTGVYDMCAIIKGNSIELNRQYEEETQQ